MAENGSKKILRKIGVELLTVIAGILIAFWINNWNESRKQATFIENMFESIQAEHAKTKTSLKNIIAEHKQLVDTLNHYINDSRVNLQEIIRKTRGYRNPVIENTYWKFILQIQDPFLIDFKVINTLDNLDNFKQNIIAQSSEIAKNMRTVEPESPKMKKGRKELVMSLVANLIFNEKALLKQYEDFDQLLESR